ncbi:tetratricopeptide repeat protein [Rhodospirillaceae bacterium KN72]|uniref:Tetratricopeptide repeat protein n=1 Tax=Pacificispira spongiicola TaxID=2729598 RepID=A0A7Y0DX59_9PROT|nr:tetratricopeptide repeat protein [Pacificispira spongiicola]NMM43244.1 tetratricopeptide repeat protein [Pacificispira spongiicola]
MKSGIGVSVRTFGAIVGTACAILAAVPVHSSADQTSEDTVLAAPSETDAFYGAYMGAKHAEIVADFSRAADLLDQVLENRPDDPLLQRRGMLANLHAGRIERAVDLARPQIAVYPSEVDIAAITLAAAAMKRGDWERAVSILEPERRIALARFSAPVIAAWAERGRDATDAAIERLAPLRAEKELPDLHDFHAGVIFLDAGRNEEADAILSPHVENLESATIGIVRAAARAKLALGEKDAAEELLTSYNALHEGVSLIEQDLSELDETGKLTPLIDGPLAGAADALVNLGLQVRHQAPLIGLRYARLAVYLDQKNDLGRMIVAAILESFSRNDEAIAELREIPADSHYGWDARMEIGDNLMQLKRDDEAIEHFEEMADERPDDIEALEQLGFLMRARDRFAEGTEYYDRALDRVKTVEPRHWTLFYNRGITLERTDRWEEAEEDLKKALELNPDEPFVLNYLGYTWVDKGIHVEEGMDMIRKAVDQRRNNGFIVDSLGWAYYRLGQYDEAVVQLERAMQLRPENGVIADHLGDAYWRVGRRTEARYQWTHALDLEDVDDDLREAIESKLKSGLDAVESAAKE